MSAFFIVYPTNVDDLIMNVRLHIGDYAESLKFSDSIIRTAIVSAVKMLQRRWDSRYLVYSDTVNISPLPEGVYYLADYNALVDAGAAPQATAVVPSGYLYGGTPQGYAFVPSGLQPNDIFRNPYHGFSDTSTSVISQEDEYAIVLMAAVILRRSYLTSSAESFVSWTDGEFSVSALQTSRTLTDMLNGDMIALNVYFQQRLASPIKDSFPINY